MNLVQGSPEWVAWRAKHIGGSEAAAVIDKCKFMTPYQLWCVKTGRAQGFEGNAATERGQEMEPKARASYEILHANFREFHPTCVEHPVHKVIGASLDGLRDDRIKTLEIKYPSQASHEMALAGEAPEHYWIQCQHGLMCVPEAESCDYWSYREGNGALVTVLPDREFQAKLIEAELAFWELVLSDTPPPLTERDAKIVNDAKTRWLVSLLLGLKDHKTKAAKDESEKLKAQVIELGGHNRIRCEHVLITQSMTKSGKPSYRMTVSGGAQ